MSSIKMWLARVLHVLTKMLDGEGEVGSGVGKVVKLTQKMAIYGWVFYRLPCFGKQFDGRVKR